MAELVFDLVVAGAVDGFALLMRLGYRGFFAPISDDGRSGLRSQTLASLGVLLFGGIAGGLTLWLWPGRLVPLHAFSGASLVLSPLLNGSALAAYGTWRLRQGATRAFIATFYGGALFGLAFAAARFAGMTHF